MKRDELAKVLLRFSLGAVFLYFGVSQIISPDNWASYVPSFLTSVILTANNLVVLNGILEITLGTFLLMGLYTKRSSLILGIHLFLITFSLGFTSIAIRDFGLSVATIVIFFNGVDGLCLDNKFK